MYTVVIAIDANFRLKRRNISSYTKDPPLAPGWGFFVDAPDYHEHCLKHANQDDVSA